MHQVKHQKESQRRARLARYGNLDMRNRLQSMYRVEDNADSRFEDLLKRLDEASAGRQESRRSN